MRKVSENDITIFKVEEVQHLCESHATENDDKGLSCDSAKNKVTLNLEQCFSLKKPTNQSYSKHTKHMKYAKKKQVPTIPLKTHNFYESLSVENNDDIKEDNGEVKADDVKELTKKATELEKNLKPKKQKKRLFQIERKKIELSNFPIENQYSVLTDNPEESVQKIKRRNELLQTSKQFLKKCKRCCFKKRSCLVDSASCNALSQHCFKCNKKGHFPQSLNCKARNKKVAEQSYKEGKHQIKKTYEINKDQLLLLKKRIKELEDCLTKLRRENLQVKILLHKAFKKI